MTWKYALLDRERWAFIIGATALVRDAKAELKQEASQARDTDLGVVPLAHVGGWIAFVPGFQLDLHLEGLAASQGRAFDGSAIFNYHVTHQWRLGLGYRVI